MFMFDYQRWPATEWGFLHGEATKLSTSIDNKGFYGVPLQAYSYGPLYTNNEPVKSPNKNGIITL